MIGNLDKLSKNPGLTGAFDLGDKLICHPELAARFTSLSKKMPARVMMPTTTGLVVKDVVIVSLPDGHGESEWSLRASRVFELLEDGDGWLFTQEDTNTNLVKGVASNLLKKGIRVTRTQVVVVPDVGEPMQGYYVVRRG